MIGAALEAVDPYRLIKDQITVENDKLTVRDREVDLGKFKNIYVVGAGKASAPMAVALEELLLPKITDGVVVVKYGHSKKTKKIKIVEAGHPIPDKNSLLGTKKILELIDRAGQNDLVFVLLSGGGSALLEMLPGEIELNDLENLNNALLSSGASIDEINTVRKHVSLVKGGQLLSRTNSATVITLILSDVISDPLESIASGPTAPDPTTFSQALSILQKYDLLSKTAPSILNRIKQGIEGKIKETPDENDKIFRRAQNIILGNNLLALKKAREIAVQAGFKSLILTDRINGEVREIAKVLAAVFESSVKNKEPLGSPGCFLLGGEPTVTIKGAGLGGRNQEMVLAMLLYLKNVKQPFYFCSVGTDGTDGPTDAAGAWIDENSFRKTLELNLDPAAFLDENDSYHFFKQTNQHIKTGPTGTNVMDLMIFLF